MTTADFNPPIGEAITLAPHVRRIVAPNPSPMTYRGTNTYIVGQDCVAIIDPGPAIAMHQDAILAAVGNAKIGHIIVTHSHLDHSPLAKSLSKVSDAPVVAFGDSLAGQSAVMRELASGGLAGGGEGVDVDFKPDIVLDDGMSIIGAEWELDVIHTPGHMGNHIVLGLNDAYFTGDLVMGWASSLVSPPDGDLDDFMASCRTLLSRNPSVLYPGHGAPVKDAAERIKWLITHRDNRTKEIVEILNSAPQTATSLAQQMYHDVPEALLDAATRNVFAHLVSLHALGRISAKPRLQSDAVFTLV